MCLCECDAEREEEGERESERWSLDERRERGLDDDSVCRLHSQSCGSSVDGARMSSVQTQQADALNSRLGEKAWGQRAEGGRRCEKTGETLGCLSQHHHTAVPRNPSSKRDTASLSPWL